MNETTLLRDPTAEAASTMRPRQAPLDSLAGKTVALMDIGKMRGDEFIDRLEALFRERGIATRRYRKPTNTRTAPIELLQKIAEECQAVVIALSDCGSCTSCSTHDLVDLDRRGLPGVSVLTEEFRGAFAAQCTAIGFDGASLYVPHPMQNRTTAELHRFAEDVFAEVIGALAPSPLSPRCSPSPLEPRCSPSPLEPRCSPSPLEPRCSPSPLGEGRGEG